MPKPSFFMRSFLPSAPAFVTIDAIASRAGRPEMFRPSRIERTLPFLRIQKDFDCRTKANCRGSARRISDLRTAGRRAGPDANSGAIGLGRFAHHGLIADCSAGVRTGRQRHMACLSAGNGVGSAGGVLHQPLCAHFGIAGFALQLCFGFAAARIRGRGRMGPAACLCGDRRLSGGRRNVLLDPARRAVSALVHLPNSHPGGHLRASRVISPIATSSCLRT